MKRTKELRRKFPAGALVCVLGLVIFCAGFRNMTFVSRAESQVKVITGVRGAILRQDAGTTSQRVGGANEGELLTVIGEGQDANGITWYQVRTKNDVTGYVRFDLVEFVTDTPPEEEEDFRIEDGVLVQYTGAGGAVIIPGG